MNRIHPMTSASTCKEALRSESSRFILKKNINNRNQQHEKSLSFAIQHQQHQQHQLLFSSNSESIDETFQNHDEETANHDHNHNQLIQLLLQQISKAGTDGTKIPQNQRDAITNTVEQLQTLNNVNQKDNDINMNMNMTAIPLINEHTLLYSDTPRSSQYIGPFKGKTTQKFINKTKFENNLNIGSLLKVTINAERQIMDEMRIKLFFKSFVIQLFGIDIVRKEMDAKGVWKMIFVGEVQVENNEHNEDDKVESRRILLRIMKTPNLYILAQEL
jgi:hypothetical protein